MLCAGSDPLHEMGADEMTTGRPETLHPVLHQATASGNPETLANQRFQDGPRLRVALGQQRIALAQQLVARGLLARAQPRARLHQPAQVRHLRAQRGRLAPRCRLLHYPRPSTLA